MNEKELLRKLGEETIHSAKGHFKACDLRRQLFTCTIWGCAIVNVIGVIGIYQPINQYISAIGLFGTIALLIWNEGEGKNYRSKHKAAAENYLALHKEIRKHYFLNSCDKKDVEEISNKVSMFDRSEKPDIPGYARKLAKKAIEKNDPETDNWFMKKRV